MALTEEKKKEWENTLKELELMNADDEIVDHLAGDYWKKGLLGRDQVRGNFFFTKERFIFCGGWGIHNLSILYNDIKELRLCNISMIMPTGIEITAMNPEKGKEEKYQISVLKRKEWLEVLKQKTMAS